MGARIDGRDRWGKWYQADIVKYKKANEALPKRAKLNKNQGKHIEELERTEAVFVHYLAWEEK